MKIHDVEQGSAEWLELRSGIPTTSAFSRIITPTGLPSKSANEYMCELLTELLCSAEEHEFNGNYWTERGSQLEPDAVSNYEFQYDVEAIKVGFITNDDETIGCSPDRLIGDDGLLEIKCPAGKKHLMNYFGGHLDMTYYPQIQGQLLVTGRKWVDWMSHHPELPPSIIRVERDEEYIKKLDELLDDFNCVLTKRRQQLTGENNA